MCPPSRQDGDASRLPIKIQHKKRFSNLLPATVPRKRSTLEIAIRQSGPAAARAAAEKAAGAVTKEGSSVGVIKVREAPHHSPLLTSDVFCCCYAYSNVNPTPCFVADLELQNLKSRCAYKAGTCNSFGAVSIEEAAVGEANALAANLTTAFCGCGCRCW